MNKLADFLAGLDRDTDAMARFQRNPKEVVAAAGLSDAAASAVLSQSGKHVQQVLDEEGGGSIPPSMSAWFRVGP